MSIRLDGDPRRDQILQAALAVFARYGFKRATMEDVASEAGISRPALYQSYENKAAIFAALAVALGQASCDAATAEAFPTFCMGLSVPASKVWFDDYINNQFKIPCS